MSDVFEIADHAAQLPLHVQLQSTVLEALAAFPTVHLLQRVRTSTLLLAHYQQLLVTLYHVAHLTPHCLARAAINCGMLHSDAQQYLQQRARAARDHSQLIQNDLANTLYAGPDIRMQPMPACAQPLISLLSFASHEAPLCTLAIIGVLDAINFTHRNCFHRIQHALQLPSTAARYLSAASSLAGEQRVEVWATIASVSVDAREHTRMRQAAERTGHYYYGLFDQMGEPHI